MFSHGKLHRMKPQNASLSWLIMFCFWSDYLHTILFQLFFTRISSLVFSLGTNALNMVLYAYEILMKYLQKFSWIIHEFHTFYIFLLTKTTSLARASNRRNNGEWRHNSCMCPWCYVHCPLWRHQFLISHVVANGCEASMRHGRLGIDVASGVYTLDKIVVMWQVVNVFCPKFDVNIPMPKGVHVTY